ncbi:hypothetical protein P7K49_002086 [Saguinus oedipus]|uniref:Uncharacterized protein n=1 Tax=Saguinus oedipus TaxID=9490 RepID=A0ABQ9WGT4_SAGOE|nr:hypothetical protein P7K49_002086 [Saguinus oedipus]
MRAQTAAPTRSLRSSAGGGNVDAGQEHPSASPAAGSLWTPERPLSTNGTTKPENRASSAGLRGRDQDGNGRTRRGIGAWPTSGTWSPRVLLGGRRRPGSARWPGRPPLLGPLRSERPAEDASGKLQDAGLALSVAVDQLPVPLGARDRAVARQPARRRSRPSAARSS